MRYLLWLSQLERVAQLFKMNLLAHPRGLPWQQCQSKNIQYIPCQSSLECVFFCIWMFVNHWAGPCRSAILSSRPLLASALAALVRAAEPARQSARTRKNKTKKTTEPFGQVTLDARAVSARGVAQRNARLPLLPPRSRCQGSPQAASPQFVSPWLRRVAVGRNGRGEDEKGDQEGALGRQRHPFPFLG